MGRAKGKVPVTIYLPEGLWEKIRELAPSLPTGKKKVSDLITKLLTLGLESYGVREEKTAVNAEEAFGESGEKEKKKGVYEVEVEGVKLFLKPVE